MKSVSAMRKGVTGRVVGRELGRGGIPAQPPVKAFPSLAPVSGPARAAGNQGGTAEEGSS